MNLKILMSGILLIFSGGRRDFGWMGKKLNIQKYDGTFTC